MIFFFSLFFTPFVPIYGQRDLSFYTTIEVLREKKYDYDQKKIWVMRNILSLDNDSSTNDSNRKKSKIQKKELGRNFFDFQNKTNKKRILELIKWQQALE